MFLGKGGKIQIYLKYIGWNNYACQIPSAKRPAAWHVAAGLAASGVPVLRRVLQDAVENLARPGPGEGARRGMQAQLPAVQRPLRRPQEGPQDPEGPK